MFSSDLHLDHSNVIRYNKRPWLREGDLKPDGTWINRGVAEDRKNEMNEALIANWNSRVETKDTIYCLGDIAFVNTEERLRELIGRLNGKIHLIRGNHDNRKIYYRCPDLFESINELAEINWEKQKIVLCHYSMRTWNSSHHGSWMLYGHSHGMLPGYGKSFDVGVDSWNYFPVSFSEVKNRMEKLEVVIDHEGRNRKN